MAKEKPEPLVDALHEMLVEAKKLIDRVAKDTLANTMTDD